MTIICEACHTNFDASTELADAASCPCCEHVNRPRGRREKMEPTHMYLETTADGGERQPRVPESAEAEIRAAEAAERASRAREAAEAEIRAVEAAERASRAREAAEAEIRAAAAAERASRATETAEATHPRPKGRKLAAAAAVVRLTVVEDGQLPRQYIVDSGRVVLGRGKCDIKVCDLEVSREHCTIDTRDGVAILRDLKSANGTVVNGHLINEHALKDGDRITIGTTVVEISVAKAA